MKYQSIAGLERYNSCAGIGCPLIIERGEYYFIIGEKVNLKEAGLEGKGGDKEELIKVPKELIGKRDRVQ
jgi:hypothetical protein